MKQIYTILVSLLVILFSGCAKPDRSADLVFMNGTLYTMDSTRSQASALAVRDGRIVAVGDSAAIQKYIGPETKTENLAGRLMLPGFIDSHTHPISAYRHFYEVNLYGIRTTSEYQNVLKDFLAKHPDEAYIRGRGWSNTVFPKIGADKKIIDAVIPDIPVRISSEDGHSVWVNSKTLELAGINTLTPDPEDGIIERYPGTLEPAGTLRESAADLVSGIFPDYTVAERVKGLEAYQEMALKLGITTAHDASLTPRTNDVAAYAELDRSGGLKMRFRASLYLDPEKDLSQVDTFIAVRNENRGGLFETNSVKIFVDGVVEGSTAYLLEPYFHLPGFRGTPIWDTATLDSACAMLDRQDFQIHVHAIGDAAASMTLDAFEATRSVNGARDSRNGITHLQLVAPGDFKRFHDLGVIAYPQPYWFIKDDYYYNLQVPYLGQVRADLEYPMKSFFDAGVRVAASSDYPVTIPCNPLDAIQIGITRTQPGVFDPREQLWPEESVTLEEMIASFTINGAYANFLENETGSLEVGKSADLIILDRNLFEIPVDEISEARVLRTYFAGREVTR